MLIKQKLQLKKSFLILPVILLISGLSAWRLLAFLILEIPAWGHGFLGWLILTLIFTLFWGGVLVLVFRFEPKLSSQQWLMMGVGATVCGLAGFLITTPAGLSKIILEVEADKVWSPNIFTATWVGDSLWDVPLTLSRNRSSQSGILEVVATGESGFDENSEVWLGSAVWPDGSNLPLDNFVADGPGWGKHEVEWDGKNRQVWASRTNQPAMLRWQGDAIGPLTLVFAEHSKGGPGLIRWNGQEQEFNLYAPELGLKGITLSTGEPVVWRAELPLTALGREISLRSEADANGNLPAILKQIKLVGIPGQEVIGVSGRQLVDATEPLAGSVIPVENGIQLVRQKLTRLPKIILTDPLVTPSTGRILLPWLENGVVVLYAAVIGALLGGGLALRLSSALSVNISLLVIGFLIAVLFGEFILGRYSSLENKYYVHPPDFEVIFQPTTDIMPGVQDNSYFITNSDGIRGDDFSPRDGYRILAIGGSTTECLYLDQSETWPQLLQDKLNVERPDGQVWVGNIGTAGRTTREHVLQTTYLLPQLPDIDAIILLLGINDFILRAGTDSALYTPNYLSIPGMQEQLLKSAFDTIPTQGPDSTPYYRQSTTLRTISRIREVQARLTEAKAISIEDDAGETTLKRRKLRQEATLEDELFDLNPGLLEYTNNINTIVDIAEEYDVRVILMTQPTMWRPDLTPEEKELLLFGWSHQTGVYYTVEALLEGITAYNEQLLMICEARGVECIDLATALPKDTTVFYDDVHFNERGADLVAETITDYLLEEAPFSVAQ